MKLTLTSWTAFAVFIFLAATTVKSGDESGFDENGRPLVDDLYPFVIKVWAGIVKSWLAFAVGPNHKQFTSIANDRIDDWVGQIIEHPVGPFGDDYKEHFWHTMEPKIDGILQQQLEAGYLDQGTVDQVKMMLSFEKADVLSKLAAFDRVASENRDQFVITHSGTTKASPLYENIIIRWRDLVKACLSLTIGEFGNMTGAEHFIDASSNWLSTWTDATLKSPPGEMGEAWRQNFWQTFNPLVDKFFQDLPKDATQKLHVKSKKYAVKLVLKLLESGALEELARYGNQLSGPSIDAVYVEDPEPFIPPSIDLPYRNEEL